MGACYSREEEKPVVYTRPVWDRDKGFKHVVSFEFDRSVYSMCVIESHDFLFGLSDVALKGFDLKTHMHVLNIRPETSMVAVCSDKHYLITGNRLGEIEFWDPAHIIMESLKPETIEPLKRMAVHSKSVSALLADDRLRKLYSVGKDKKLRVVNINTYEIEQAQMTTLPFTPLFMMAHADTLVVTGMPSDDELVYYAVVLELRSLYQKKVIPLPPNAGVAGTCAAHCRSTPADILAIATDAGAVFLYECKTYQKLGSTPELQPRHTAKIAAMAACYSAPYSCLLVLSEDATINIWDVSSNAYVFFMGAIKLPYSTARPPKAMLLHNDYVYIGCPDGIVVKAFNANADDKRASLMKSINPRERRGSLSRSLSQRLSKPLDPLASSAQPTAATSTAVSS